MRATFLLSRYLDLAATTGTASSFTDAAHSWHFINWLPCATRRRGPRVVRSDPLPGRSRPSSAARRSTGRLVGDSLKLVFCETLSVLPKALSSFVFAQS